MPPAVSTPPPTPETPPLATEPPPETSAKPIPEDMIPRISIEELKQKVDSGADILIVDARHKEEYDVDHIKGAVLAPLSDILENEWQAPTDKELILY